MPPRRRRSARLATTRRVGPLRWLGRGITALLALAVVVLLVLAGMLHGSLPPEEETLTIAELE
ncbi:MAG: hypothetical protein K2X74_14160, partial [Acetobacteraceae bacterium]|nr:hypothetical protein [Acetobacteraceae bacterium]